jgi:hypothetical protein
MRALALTLMLALAAQCHAGDVDPEPPGAGVRQLLGKWESVKHVSKGVERPFTTTSYAFEKDKATCTFGGGKGGPTRQERTYKIDARRRAVLMTYNGKTQTHFFKIEKGELYLSIDRSNDLRAKPAFSGKTSPMVIFKKAK